MNERRKVLATVADVESAMNELQRVQAALDVSTGNANSEISTVREEYVKETSSLEEQAKRLKSAIEAWAEANRDDEEIFQPGKKSLELQAGTISFRMGAEKVVLRKGVKTDDVIERAQEMGIKGILSTPDPTLDKTAVKNLVEKGKIDEKTLKALGLDITQDETFTLKLNTLETYA